jgi:integrase
MKKYSCKTAARMLVNQRVELGVSRHAATKHCKEVVTSVGTARNHSVALKGVAIWLYGKNGKHLKNLNSEDAAEYLTLRSMTAGQSAVDLDRQAINFHILRDEPIPYFLSAIPRDEADRAYTTGEIYLLLQNCGDKLNLSIRLAANAGLRALELITIAPVGCLNESKRDWHKERFTGREEDVAFVVHGKGGLRRQVRLAPDLADELIQQLRPMPIKVRDREVIHTSHFDLVSGANFSMQFSMLSQKVLGESHGAHGLRHTFAQKRLRDLLCCGLDCDLALKVLSNELGHFAVKNTFAYLRN